MAWMRKSYGGGAVATTLNGAISSSTLSIAVTSGSSWPDGSAGKFVVSIDRAGTEEKILVTSRSGNVLTVSSRGYDGTANVAHSTGVTAEHVFDADSANQANAAAAAMATAGSQVFRGAGDTFTELPIGSNGDIQSVVAGIPAFVSKLVAKAVDIQTFTSNGTWTKPVAAAGCTRARGGAIGAGGGGGSGCRGAAASFRGGGGGGGGGARVMFDVPLSLFGGTESIVVGTAGTGGTAITADSTPGNAGTNGGDSSIGMLVIARGGGSGSGGVASNSNFGGYSGAGAVSSVEVGVGTFVKLTGPGVGGAPNDQTSGHGSSVGGPGFGEVAAGGGGGGTILTSNVAQAATAGGAATAGPGGAAGATTPTAGGAGTAAAALSGLSGSGGGGGGTNATTASAGGAGAIYGAGGGGGGASLNANNSGAGGAGAAGFVMIVCY